MKWPVALQNKLSRPRTHRPRGVTGYLLALFIESSSLQKKMLICEAKIIRHLYSHDHVTEMPEVIAMKGPGGWDSLTRLCSNSFHSLCGKKYKIDSYCSYRYDNDNVVILIHRSLSHFTQYTFRHFDQC